MTDLLLIRHAQAMHNPAGQWQGWGPTPLTEEGQRQAESVAERLKDGLYTPGSLYSSPLRRAMQTAEPISQKVGLSIATHDGLKEIDFGKVSGLTLEAFRAAMPEVYARWNDRSDLRFQFPAGEERRAFYQRVANALEEIVSLHPLDAVVVVAHGGTIRAGLASLLPDTMGDWWGYALDNASLTHVRAVNGRNELLMLNCRNHLDTSE